MQCLKVGRQRVAMTHPCVRMCSYACIPYVYRTPTPLARQLTAQGQAVTARVRGLMLPFAALVAITASSGAFVAGAWNWQQGQ